MVITIIKTIFYLFMIYHLIQVTFIIGIVGGFILGALLLMIFLTLENIIFK